MISSIQAHRPLDGLTTFGTRSEADHYAEAGSLDELEAHLAEANANGLPVHFLGAGANTIAMSRVLGMTIRITIKGVEMSAAPNGDVLVKCGAGEVFDDIVARTLKAGIGGLENLSAIPGTVGGAVVQNIGAYGCEAKDAIRRVEMYCVETGNLLTLDAAHCGFGYRESVFKHDLKGRVIITAIEIRLSHTPRPKLGYGDVEREVEARGGATLRNIREAICSIRRAKLPDPAVLGNAGSFFKNPVVEAPVAERLLAEYPDMPHYAAPEGRVKLAAGWLIDRAGMKGYREGSVGVHERQALVLVNHGGATGGEVIAFARTVQAKVREKFGIEIDTEVNIL